MPRVGRNFLVGKRAEVKGSRHSLAGDTAFSSFFTDHRSALSRRHMMDVVDSYQENTTAAGYGKAKYKH